MMAWPEPGSGVVGAPPALHVSTETLAAAADSAGTPSDAPRQPIDRRMTLALLALLAGAVVSIAVRRAARRRKPISYRTVVD